MNIYLDFLAALCCTYLLVSAYPINVLKEFFTVDLATRPLNKAHGMLITFFNCAMCLGFWVGLYWYRNETSPLEMAFITSIASELFYSLVKRVCSWV